MATDIWRKNNIEKLRKYRRKWYGRNKEHAKLKSLKRKQYLRQWLNNYKKTLRCCLCGEAHIACLEFHHRDPCKKEINVTATINQGWSKKRILGEIEKCDVYCANCHRKLHHN